MRKLFTIDTKDYDIEDIPNKKDEAHLGNRLVSSFLV